MPICQKLGIAVPDLFYVPSKELNAWTFGSIKPYICVTSTLVEKLTSQQIASVLAHECVIKGNLVIQKVLGREPQFTNQEEFDELMESDTALVL